MAAVVTPIRPVGGRCLRLLPSSDGALTSSTPTRRGRWSRWHTTRVCLVVGPVRWSLLDVAHGGGHVHVMLFGGWRSMRLCRAGHTEASRPGVPPLSPTRPDEAA